MANQIQKLSSTYTTMTSQPSFKYITIGGLHGNEPLGIDVVPKIQRLNQDWLQAEYGNPRAIQDNVRFTQTDLNRVFPGDVGGDYEQRRAVELMQTCQNFDFVLDFHNTHGLDNDCGFVGGNDWKQTVNLAGFLGINKVIVADYDCINKYAPGCLSIEISLSSPLNNSDTWVRKLETLRTFNPDIQYQTVELFTFVYRVTRQQQINHSFSGWQTFVPIPSADATTLGLNQNKQYYPIFIDDEYTAKYNFAGLLEKI